MNEHIKIFDIARQLYPGSKVGNANEFKNFVFRSMYPNKPMCKYDIKEVLPLLAPAIKRQIQWRKEARADEFRPPWKNFQTWINDNYWEFEPPLTKAVHAPKMCHVCGGNPSGQTGGKWHCPDHNPYKPPKFQTAEQRSSPPLTSKPGTPPTDKAGILDKGQNKSPLITRGRLSQADHEKLEAGRELLRKMK